jgi:hypothetical protein
LKVGKQGLESVPVFKPGRNVAIKIPAHEYERTIAFYRDVIRLVQRDTSGQGIAFDFGDKILWLDKADGLNQAEIWLEIETDDLTSAA